VVLEVWSSIFPFSAGGCLKDVETQPKDGGLRVEIFCLLFQVLQARYMRVSGSHPLLSGGINPFLKVIQLHL